MLKVILLLFAFLLPAHYCQIAAPTQPATSHSNNLEMCADDFSFATINPEIRVIRPDSIKRVPQGIRNQGCFAAQKYSLHAAIDQWDYG